jgi:hypothetical protein
MPAPAANLRRGGVRRVCLEGGIGDTEWAREASCLGSAKCVQHEGADAGPNQDGCSSGRQM